MIADVNGVDLRSEEFGAFSVFLFYSRHFFPFFS